MKSQLQIGALAGGLMLLYGGRLEGIIFCVFGTIGLKEDIFNKREVFKLIGK